MEGCLVSLLRSSEHCLGIKILIFIKIYLLRRDPELEVRVVSQGLEQLLEVGMIPALGHGQGTLTCLLALLETHTHCDFSLLVFFTAPCIFPGQNGSEILTDFSL